MANLRGRGKTSVGKTMLLLTKLDKGESFYTTVAPKNVQAYAGSYDVKCKAELCLVIEDYGTLCPETKKLTKVTIL